MLPIAFLSLLFLIAGSAPSAAHPQRAPLRTSLESTANLAQQVNSIVEAARREIRLPGVSLVITRGNRVVLAKGYGLADREKGTAPTEQTIYPIGSLSKQFTAAAIMKLVEQGRVRLDEPVATYLPEYHATHSKVLRMRHLLLQTSGIPEMSDLPEMDGMDTGTGDPAKFTLARVIELLGHQPQLYPPGDWWSYSNSNYSLLAAVIERVSGKTYEQYLSETLFRPLGLRSTGSCQPEQGLPLGSHSVGYLATENSFELRPFTPNNARVFTGSGGLCSNAADLASWVRALVDGRAVSAASFRQMTTTTPVGAGFTPPYGFGLSVVPLAGQPAVWHTGVIAGFTSVLVYFPKQDLTIAALTNSRHALLQAVVKRVAQAVMRSKEPKLRDLPVSAEQLSRVVGDYDDNMFKFRIYAESGRLYINVPELGSPQRLQYQGGEMFATPEPGMVRRLWFEPETGSVARVIWEWAELRAFGHRAR